MAINGPTGRSGSIQLNTGSTSVRQTPRTDFGTQMRSGVAVGGAAVGNAVGVAAPFVPGAAVVSAAINGAAGAVGGGGAGMAGGGAGMGGGFASVGDIPMGGPGLGTQTGQAPSGGSAQQDLMNQTKAMQEMQMSFNLQYLQLQEKMQGENRQFSTVTNVMKTKHDTAKSTIQNVR